MRTSGLMIVGLSALLLTTTTQAEEGISIQPGKWEITTTMTSSMSPQAHDRTDQQCIDKSQISPQDLTPSDTGECSISDSTTNGQSVSWSMSCNTPGGTMTGQGNFTSAGDTGTGDMQMNMNVEGQSINMQMTWQGKRIGPC